MELRSSLLAAGRGRRPRPFLPQFVRAVPGLGYLVPFAALVAVVEMEDLTAIAPLPLHVGGAGGFHAADGVTGVLLVAILVGLVLYATGRLARDDEERR